MAVGSESNYFGLESVARNGFDLKDLNDAEAIRNHILSMFEFATLAEDPETCQALRTFVVVGGGPTGVECAGEISELIRLVLKKDFPGQNIGDVRVIIVEMLDRLLAGFPEELGQSALESLGQKHVEVLLNTAVEGFNGQVVCLKNGETIPARTLIWAAGVRARSLVDRLPVRKGRSGRVIVEPTLQLPGYPEVFVVGDAAYLEAEGQPLPMMAPVAIQQAKTAARFFESGVRLITPAPEEESELQTA
jgi:NADH dehydrogenase